MADRRHIPTGQGAAAARQARALLHVWLSPSFPVGAFAYSHGLEKAVENGWITNQVALEAWLCDLVVHGALHNDLVLLTEAWASAARNDQPGLRRLADLAAALQPCAERYLEATQQGQSFLRQIDGAWAPEALRIGDVLAGTSPTVAVVLGAAAHAHAIPHEDTALAFAVSFIGNLVSAAIRLSIIGQSDGQRTLAALMPVLASAVERASRGGLAGLGGASFRSDIAGMQHETQHTRLFRS